MRNITNNTPKGANLGSPVVKTNDTDKKGTFYAYQSIGGLVPVLNEEDRNSIPVDTKLNEDGYTSGQRELGMVVWYMLSDKLELWRLYIPDYDSLNTAQKIAALGDNDNWIEAELGTTSTWQGNWVSGMAIIPDGVVVYNDDLYQSTRAEEFISNVNPESAGNTYFRILSKQDLSDYITASELNGYDLTLRGGYAGDLQDLSQGIGDLDTRLDNVETKYKGDYPSYTALIAAWPTASAGDYAIVDPIGEEAQKYIWDNTEDEWVTGGQGNVLSVNGETGVVVLDKSDIGLGNVDNTSDANKPVSNAQAIINTGFNSRIAAIENGYLATVQYIFSGSYVFSFPNGQTPDAIVFVSIQHSSYVEHNASYTFIQGSNTFTLTDMATPNGAEVMVVYKYGNIPVNTDYATLDSFLNLQAQVNSFQTGNTVISQNLGLVTTDLSVAFDRKRIITLSINSPINITPNVVGLSPGFPTMLIITPVGDVAPVISNLFTYRGGNWKSGAENNINFFPASGSKIFYTITHS